MATLLGVGRTQVIMNLRRQRPSDSLDMLLDTMCNTFGGIILLAVLVTLLTSRERHDSEATASDTQEMLQRRIARAEEDLEKAMQFHKSLQAKASDARWTNQVSLLTTRQQIQDEINQTREAAAKNVKELNTAVSADPAERMKDLNAKFQSAQETKLAASNRLATSKENSERLKQRLAALEKQVVSRVNESQRQLRLPKEHETGKRVIYAIVRYGRIYACRNSDLSRNETDIEWTLSLTTELAVPKPGKGMDPSINTAGLQAYFRKQVENSAYVAFCVFEDSFPAFLRAKQLATETGLAYGWEPFQIARPVVFSDTGEAPKPQSR